MTQDEWNEMLVPGINAFKRMDKPEIEPPIRTSELFEHHREEPELEDFLDGMSIGEYELARKYPLEYDRQVNGIKHIVVRDLDTEYRYRYEDGKLIMPEVF